jgi:outer membrane lipoprotein-sorting protein
MVRRSLAVAVQALFVLAGAQAALAQTADSLVARNIEAKGGEQALRAVQGIRQTATMSMQGMSATMTTIARRPNMMRQEIELNGQQMISAFDGTTVWTLSPPQGITTPTPVADPATAQLLKDQAQFDGPLLDYKSNGSTVELVGTETVAGKQAHHLRVTLKSGSVQDLFLDATTGLESRLILQTPNGPMIQDISDYRKVNGLTVPFALSMTLNGVPVASITVTKVEFNPTIDNAIFKMAGK